MSRDRAGLRSFNQLTPKDRGGILADFIGGASSAEICKKYKISIKTFNDVQAVDHIDREREKVVRLTQHVAVNSARAVAVREARKNAYATTKASLEHMEATLVDLFDAMVDAGMTPKSIEGAVKAMATVADLKSKMTEAGDQLPKEINIKVTGARGGVPDAYGPNTAEVVTVIPEERQVEDGSIIDTPPLSDA